MTRLGIESDGDPRSARISLDGEPVKNASRLELVMDVDGTSFVRMTYPAPMVTLAVNEMASVNVFRAQLVTTLGIDPALDGLVVEAYSVEDALVGLTERVREVRANVEPDQKLA